MPKQKTRGPDLRPRLKPGQVRCAECGEQLPAPAAVTFNEKTYHPIGCFGRALERVTSAMWASLNNAWREAVR